MVRKQPTISATVSRATPYDGANPKVSRFNKLLVDLVCREGLPFRLVETPSFRAFVRELDPRHQLPTRKALSAILIPQAYQDAREEIRVLLTTAKSFALTTDMWTSSANDSYMGVTCHFIDADFAYHNKCLAIRYSPGSHTAAFIKTMMSDILTEWGLGLGSQHVHVVTDSGANVKKAMAMMNNVIWRACFGHTLQLVVLGGLGDKKVCDLPKMLAKARTIVGHFRRSPLATSDLLKAQQQLKAPEHRLQQDCATRWNSQVSLIQYQFEFIIYNFNRILPLFSNIN